MSLSLDSLNVDEKLVRHVAKLCQLKLSDEEINHYQENLKIIIGYVDELRSVEDESNFNPLLVPWDSRREVLIERKDQAFETITKEDAVREAQDKLGSAFKVPRIL